MINLPVKLHVLMRDLVSNFATLKKGTTDLAMFSGDYPTDMRLANKKIS
jgi:hypothetical protein